jgi:hypothetical protein
VEVAVRSPRGDALSNCSGCGAPTETASASVPLQEGDYTFTYDYYYCNEPTPRVHVVMVVPVKLSISCWFWSGEMGTQLGHPACVYRALDYPCVATCIPPPGTPKYPLEPGETCPSRVGYVIPYGIFQGQAVCSALGSSYDASAGCICGDYSIF